MLDLTLNILHLFIVINKRQVVALTCLHDLAILVEALHPGQDFPTVHQLLQKAHLKLKICDLKPA